MQFDAASKMLSMYSIHPRVRTYTHTESGYVTLRSHAEFSFKGEPNIQVSDLVSLDQLELDFSQSNPFSFILLYCINVLFSSLRKGKENQEIIHSQFSISIVFHVNVFFQAHGCSLCYGAACNNSSEKIALKLVY